MRSKLYANWKRKQSNSHAIVPDQAHHSYTVQKNNTHSCVFLSILFIFYYISHILFILAKTSKVIPMKQNPFPLPAHDISVLILEFLNPLLASELIHSPYYFPACSVPAFGRIFNTFIKLYTGLSPVDYCAGAKASIAFIYAAFLYWFGSIFNTFIKVYPGTFYPVIIFTKPIIFQTIFFLVLVLSLILLSSSNQAFHLVVVLWPHDDIQYSYYTRVLSGSKGNL